MERGTNLETFERDAYRASWSDGIIDLYGGLSLLWIGACWIWLSDLAGVAGVLPAVFVAPMLVARKRFLEPRIGYVQWRGRRREWERRNLWAVLMTGVGLFLGAIVLVAYQAGDGGAPSIDLAPGLMAWLLGLFAVGLALITQVWRMLVYAVVLALAGVAVVAAGANPGWALLAGGATATIVGVVLLIRFVGRYPVVDRA